ncbi:hypothetical protein [Corallococcus caeni]|uniref:hypothetical protein n=1 Tax=Corallococcus caeni TaxID=3082388 RepID=UPI0030C6924F
MSAQSSTGQHGLGAVIVARMELPPPPYQVIRGSLILLALGLLFCGSAASIAMDRARQPDTAPVLFNFALVCGLSSVAFAGFSLARRAALRCGFALYEQGIVISRRGTDLRIPFSEVQSFSLKQHRTLFDGRHDQFLRQMEVTWRGYKTLFFQLTEANTQDTFGPVLDQLLHKLADAASARLGAGDALRGQGWTLENRGLILDGQDAVPLRELARVSSFDDKVSFWREGETLPFFSIDDDSPNARQLCLLAQQAVRTQDRPPRSERAQSTDDSLGRVLFQRKVSDDARAAATLVALVAIFVGAGMGISFGFVAVTGVLWGIAALLLYFSRQEFRAHELGVSGKKLRWRTLFYSELTSFQCAKVRIYQNGVFMGTKVSMRFTPGPGRKAMTFSQGGADDVALETLREHVTRVVATRLVERFKRGEDIPWGSKARFTQEGLVIRISRLLHVDREQLVPYGAIFRYQVEGGHFYLFLGQEPQAILSLPCAADNFYPGLKLLEALHSFAAAARASA